MTGKFKYALAGCGLLVMSSALAHNKDWEAKDANNDGRVSRAEFITEAEEKFSAMDTNNDSVVTENEFDEYKEHKKDKDKDRDS